MANAARNAGSYWGVVSGPAKPVTQARQLTQITSWALMVSGGLHCSALQECLCLHSSKSMAEDNKMCVRFLRQYHISMPRNGNWASLLWIEAPPHSTSPAARPPSLPEEGWREPVMCDSHHHFQPGWEMFSAWLHHGNRKTIVPGDQAQVQCWYGRPGAKLFRTSKPLLVQLLLMLPQ